MFGGLNYSIEGQPNLFSWEGRTEQQMEYEKCPKCGNENLKIYEQIAVCRVRSVRTGKVLKNDGFLETQCWNYFCKCGWTGEMLTQ